MSKQAGSIQEQAVFSALCPKELMKIIEDPLISYSTYIKVINMYNLLGFEELSCDFSIVKWSTVYKNCPEVSKIATGFDIELYLKLKGENLNELPYVQMFLSNIKSLSLLDLFQKKTDYLY